MTTYTSKVTDAFINRRDYLALQLKDKRRTLTQKMVNCDCEYAEHHQPTLMETQHHHFPGYEYDTHHDEYGKVEFKHVPKNKNVYISKWCQEQDFDTFCFWRFKDRDWSRPLIAGDIITYEILGYKTKQEVIDNINNEVYYEYFHSV